MLDSGAFSAWRKNDPIDVKDYIAYVRKHEHLLDQVVNLDVIPGKYPKPPSDDEREKSAVKGWDNLMRMADAGINAIPVYHQGERFYWLDKMVDKGYDYIGLSPDNTKSLSGKREWLTNLFRDICDGDGNPIFKAHGFAVTAVELMFKYPWYSFDSMTWLLAASYGGIFLPRVGKYFKESCLFDYRRVPFTMKISKESPTIKTGNHFNNLPPTARTNYIRLFESQGFSFEDVNTSFIPRTILNLRCLQRIESPFTRINFKDRHAFFPVDGIGGRAVGIHIDKTRFIVAVNLARKYSDILTDERVFDRLFTYYLLRDTKDGFLDEYVMTGRMPKAEGKEEDDEGADFQGDDETFGGVEEDIPF